MNSCSPCSANYSCGTYKDGFLVTFSNCYAMVQSLYKSLPLALFASVWDLTLNNITLRIRTLKHIGFWSGFLLWRARPLPPQGFSVITIHHDCGTLVEGFIHWTSGNIGPPPRAVVQPTKKHNSNNIESVATSCFKRFDMIRLWGTRQQDTSPLTYRQCTVKLCCNLNDPSPIHPFPTKIRSKRRSSHGVFSALSPPCAALSSSSPVVLVVGRGRGETETSLGRVAFFKSRSSLASGF